MRRRGTVSRHSIALSANKSQRYSVANKTRVIPRCIGDVRAQVYAHIVEHKPAITGFQYVTARPKNFTCALCKQEKAGGAKRTARDAQGERIEVCAGCARGKKSEETK